MSAITTALSGLLANTAQLDATANNIANLETSGALSGTPPAYTPQTVLRSAVPGGGVTTRGGTVSPTSTPAYSPDLPYANAAGLVAMPAIDLGQQMVDQVTALRAYQANIKVVQTADDMTKALLERG